ncbi:MAG: dephospho-CoA kinase [Acholeplasmataceae bacterium]|jgi:dephospho-CoA kinase|nr:dephospho-CoA kinase [Acholeplasmataceae bacterium]
MSVHNVSHKPILVGLTGGIASGKTTALNYFKQLNLPVIDSDDIVKDLWATNEEMIHKAESFFGFSIRSQEDLKKLAKIIFSNKKKRDKLNHIVHPYVFKHIEIEKKKYDDEQIIIIDMPLLIEAKYQSHVHYVCLVYVDLETQLSRLMNRDPLTKEEAMKRINSQMSLEHKKEYADYIFDNTSTIDYLHHQIDKFLGGLHDEKQ